MKRVGLTLLIALASLVQVEWAAAHTLLSSVARPHDCGCRETTSCCCKRSATPTSASTGMQCHREPAPAPGASLLQSTPCGSRQAILMLKALRDPVLYDPVADPRTEHHPSSPALRCSIDRRLLVPLDPPLIPPEPSSV